MTCTYAATARICERHPPRYSLDGGPVLGQVTSVDAGRLLVTLADDGAADRASVSALVALHAGDGFLLGIIDRLTCSENLDRVIAHIMPVGAFYPSSGGGGTFRLGAAHQPRIRAGCFLVEGERLSQFMGSVADGVSPQERLILGRYGDEKGVKAVADGNRLFQRHLAILGNSGAGKSWAVALLMERAARLRSANLIVLDLHGEYGPLADAGMATRLRIAGAADQPQDADDQLHLPYWLFEIDELAIDRPKRGRPALRRSATVADPSNRGSEAFLPGDGRQLQRDGDRDRRLTSPVPAREVARVGGA